MPAVSSELNSSPDFYTKSFILFRVKVFNTPTAQPIVVLAFVPVGDIFIRPSGVPRSAN